MKRSRRPPTDRILYSSPFVPAAWIAAHGFAPVRVAPVVAAAGAAPGGAREGVCPYAQAFAQAVAGWEDARGIVFAPLCDQMRRMAELAEGACAAPVFAMHVPRTRVSAAAGQMYRNELRRLGRFLLGLGGRKPDHAALAECLRRFGRRRESLCRLQGTLPGRLFAELAMAPPEGETDAIPELAGTPPSPGAVPIALVGGPLAWNHLTLFDLVERSGGRVVLDATESGERGWPRRFDEERLAADPFEEMADAYFGGIFDAALRPNAGFYRWFGQAIEARGARGIVLHHYVWCDLWHAEAARLREWAPIPLLVVASGNGEVPARTRTGVEAFLEALR